MTFESLRCLCAVAEEGGFHGAARRLHRSQPAISHQVRALERELGCALIDRRTSKLTPPGEAAYARGKRLLADREDLQRAVAAVEGDAPDELRIGCSDTSALYLLPRVVRAFQRRYPNTRLRLFSRSTNELIAATKRGDLELSVVTLPVDDDELEAEPLAEQRFVLAVPKNHALAKRKRIRLDAIADEPYLRLDPATRTGRFLADQLEVAGIAPPVAVDSGSFEVIKRYVGEGIGVALLPDFAVGKADTRLTAVQVLELDAIEMGTIGRRGAFRGATTEAFLELLRDAIER